MRFQKLGYTALGVITALTLNTVVPVLAENVQKEITAYFNDIKIYVDGAVFTPKDINNNVIEPFVYDGIIYLPVGAVAEAVGKTFEWEGETQSVYIGKKPGSVLYMTDTVPAYQTSNFYTEYSALKSGGTEKFNLAGITYTDGFTLPIDNYWAVYNLNGIYSSLTGVLCHVDGTRNDSGGTLQIFYDGVLKHEFDLASDMAPIDLNLSVRGVNQLKVATKGSTSSSSYGIGNPVLE